MARESALITDPAKALIEGEAPDQDAQAEEKAFLQQTDLTERPGAELPGSPATPAAPVTPAATPPVAEPEFVHVKKADLDLLHQTATGFTEMKAVLDRQFGTAFGKLGSLEQTLKTLQERTPTGEPVVLTAEDMAELREDFPDLTDNMIKGLNRALAKVKGTGGAPTGALTVEQVNQLITDATTKITQQHVVDRITDRHADWLDLVNGPVLDDGFRHPYDAQGKPLTQYREWLATQPKDVQKQLTETWNAATVIKSLDDFKKAHPVAPPASRPSPSTRSTRLLEAARPKGGGGALATGQTEDDGWNATKP